MFVNFENKKMGIIMIGINYDLSSLRFYEFELLKNSSRFPKLQYNQNETYAPLTYLQIRYDRPLQNYCTYVSRE